MAYQQCFQCGVVTDKDELKCPSCGESLLADGIITSEELISRIKKREIALSKIWTKNPVKIYQAL